MGRSAIAIFTGLCTAPLFALLGFWLTGVLTGPGGGSDGSIANAYLALLVGLLAGIGGGILTATAAALLLPARFRVLALIGDGALAVALIVGWQIAFAEPAPLEYDGMRPVLEAEIRVPKALGGRDAVREISFSEGLLDRIVEDQVREDGDFVIVPWETAPHRVKAWTVLVLLEGEQAWTAFDLTLPRRPTNSTSWSQWLAPRPDEEHGVSSNVSLRWRFQLVPFGQ